MWTGSKLVQEMGLAQWNVPVSVTVSDQCGHFHTVLHYSLGSRTISSPIPVQCEYTITCETGSPASLTCFSPVSQLIHL